MPTKKPILTVVVSDELLEAIDDIRFGKRLKSRSETIKLLLETAIKNGWTPLDTNTKVSMK